MRGAGLVGALEGVLDVEEEHPQRRAHRRRRRVHRQQPRAAAAAAQEHQDGPVGEDEQVFQRLPAHNTPPHQGPQAQTQTYQKQITQAP